MNPPFVRRVLAVLVGLSLSACTDDLTEPRPAEVVASMAVGALGGGPVTASVNGGAPALLASTRVGELLRIDLADGSIRELGEAEAFEGVRPAGWTGLARRADGRVFALSRTSDDPRQEGCQSNSSSACTHLYEIDGATGLIVKDFGSLGITQISDMDFAPDGTLYANHFAGAGGRLLRLDIDPVTDDVTVVSTGNTFGGAGVYVPWELQNGAISVDPSTGDIWVVENTWSESYRMARIDPATGIQASIVVLDVPGQFGFDALEILPDGRFIAARARDVFEMYELDPTTGEVTPIAITVPPEVRAAPTGLDLAPAIQGLATFDVVRADAVFHPGNLPGADEIVFEATFTFVEGADGFDAATEPFILTLGDFVFPVPPGGFVRFEGQGLYRYGLGFGGPAVLELRDDGTVFLQAGGFSLSTEDLGGFAAALTLGADFGETDGVWATPAGVPSPTPAILLGVTNWGELLRIDVAAQTATLLGRARNGGARLGWTGVAASPGGELLVTSRWRDGTQADGCAGGFFEPGDGKCAHLYAIDPNTGQIVRDAGNTGVKYVSDLDFSGTTLLGSEFRNTKGLGDGGLVTLDPGSGIATRVGEYGAAGGVPLDNGGLSVDPITGAIWAIESTDASTPRIFMVDPATAAPSSVALLKENGRSITFGFDGLEIVDDGRFYATRGADVNGLYRIDPATGEARLIPLAMDPAVRGSLTDLSRRPAGVGLTATAALTPVADKSLKSKKGTFTVEAVCLDPDDATTTTTATINGVPVENGQEVELKLKSAKSRRSQKSAKSGKSAKSLKIEGPSFELLVMCSNTGGEVATATAEPVFAEKSAKSEKSRKSRRD